MHEGLICLAALATSLFRGTAHCSMSSREGIKAELMVGHKSLLKGCVSKPFTLVHLMRSVTYWASTACCDVAVPRVLVYCWSIALKGGPLSVLEALIISWAWHLCCRNFRNSDSLGGYCDVDLSSLSFLVLGATLSRYNWAKLGLMDQEMLYIHFLVKVLKNSLNGN
jgi:hypothetical protein